MAEHAAKPGSLFFVMNGDRRGDLIDTDFTYIVPFGNS